MTDEENIETPKIVEIEHMNFVCDVLEHCQFDLAYKDRLEQLNSIVDETQNNYFEQSLARIKDAVGRLLFIRKQFILQRIRLELVSAENDVLKDENEKLRNIIEKTNKKKKSFFGFFR